MPRAVSPLQDFANARRHGLGRGEGADASELGQPLTARPSLLEQELRRPRIPVACVSLLVLLVVVSSTGDDTPAAAAAPPPPPPSPGFHRRGENCIRGPPQCSDGNSSWDLQDDDGGPCIDVRNSPTYLAAYDRAMTFAEEFYAYHEWKRLDFTQIRTAGRAAAKKADETGDSYYLQLAIAQLVAQFPDGHVQREALSDDDDFTDCGPAAEEIAARLKFDHIGGGFGLTLAQLDSGEIILTGVVPGSAAAAAGLSAGDAVLQIDGVPALAAVTGQGAAGWTWIGDYSNPATADTRLSEQFRSIARAPVGTERSFTWSRSHHAATATLTAEADDFLTWNICAPLRPWYHGDDDNDDDDDEAAEIFHYQMLSDGVTGYIGIGEEEIEDMAEQMVNALVDLRSRGATGLVMDMRGNDGGNDEQVLDILKFFIPPESPVRVYERASYSNRLLSIAKGGQLRQFMNGTNPTTFGIVDVPVGGAYGVLHSGPMDEDDQKVWATVPSSKRQFIGRTLLSKHLL